MTEQWIEIPDGYYAVPNPTAPDEITLWRVTDDDIQPSPPGARYAPQLLRRDVPAGLTKIERAQWIAAWFETNQHAWHRTVRAAIAADPNAAGTLYAKTAIRCRDCGRPLKDPKSKAAGRGPDCRAQLAQLIAEAWAPVES